GDASLDLYPATRRPDIDEVNAFVYDNINNGVYRCGLAKSQAAYAEAFHKLFAALDELEHRLGRQGWLVGGRFTETDLRLFPTLLRFDTVYYVLFKCNLRRLADYHNLSNYLREIYQMPGVAETVDFELIKLMGWTAPGTASACQDEVVDRELIKGNRPWSRLPLSGWTSRRTSSRFTALMWPERCWCASSCGELMR